MPTEIEIDILKKDICIKKRIRYEDVLDIWLCDVQSEKHVIYDYDVSYKAELTKNYFNRKKYNRLVKLRAILQK